MDVAHSLTLVSRLRDVSQAAQALSSLLRTKLGFSDTALSTFVERGFFAAETTFNGEPTPLLDRFLPWFRQRSCDLEAQFTTHLDSLYRDILSRFDLQGPMPNGLVQRRLTLASQELEALTRLNDLSDLCAALLPLYESIVTVDEGAKSSPTIA